MKTVFTSIILSTFLISASAQDFQISLLSDDLLTHTARGFAQGLQDTVFFYTDNDKIFKADTSGQVIEITYDCPSYCDVQDIFVSSDGALYVATKWGGLLKITSNTNEVLIEDTDVKSVAVSASGSVFAGLTDGGLSVNTGSGWTNYNKNNSGLESNLIYDIDIDADGVAWLATHSGLAKLSGNSISNYTSPNLSATFYKVKAGGDGTVWASSSYGGVGGLMNGSWTTFSSIFSSFASTSGVGVSPDNSVWTVFAADDILLRIRDGVAATVSFDDLGLGGGFIVYAFFVDNRGQAWISLNSSSDIAIVSEDITNPTLNITASPYGINLFPNPSKGVSKLSFNSALTSLKDKSIIIYNAIGQEVFRSSIPNQAANFNLMIPNIKKGIYFYQIEKNKQPIYSGRIIIE